MTMIHLLLGALGPGDRISIDDFLANDVATSPADANITVTFKSDGSIEKTAGVTVTDLGDWISPTINMANYSIKATLNSGTLTSGTTGSFLSLASDRSWNVTRTNNTAGSDSAELLLEIVLTASTSIVLDSATVTLTATVVGP